MSAAILAAASSLISGAMEFFDGDRKREAEFILKQMDAEKDLAMRQMDVNKAEAETSSLFIGGWRPFIGWVCGVAIAYEFVIRPFGLWGIAAYAPGSPVLPSISGNGMLWELIAGMLGIATLRTFEKSKRVAR